MGLALSHGQALLDCGFMEVKFTALRNEMHKHLLLKSLDPQQGIDMSHSMEAELLSASVKLASPPGPKGNLKRSVMLCWSIRPLPGCESQEPIHLRCSSSGREPSHLAGLNPEFSKVGPQVGPVAGKQRVFLLGVLVLCVLLVALREQAAGCCIRLCCPSPGLRQETVSCCCQKIFGLFLSYQDFLSQLSLLGLETKQPSFLLGESEVKSS